MIIYQNANNNRSVKNSVTQSYNVKINTSTPETVQNLKNLLYSLTSVKKEHKSSAF